MRASLSLNPSRYYLLDILRWISFYAIVVYHLTYALWAPGGWAEIPIRGFFVWPLESFARVFAFSGFTVFFLSFFLFGHRAATFRPHYLLAWILPFAVVWGFLVEESPLAWDIYPLLIFTLGAMALLIRMRIPPILWVTGSSVAMSFPYWVLESRLTFPSEVTAALVGACGARRDWGEWPILPWFFFATFAYGVGRLTYPLRNALSKFTPTEFAFWCAPLALSLPFLGAYAATPLGEQFGCYIFRRSPLEFWAHLIWLLFAVRLALTTGINSWLARLPGAQRISQSPINRAFFLVYFAHYPLVAAVGLWARRWDLNFQTWILAVSFAMIVLIVECSPGALWRKVNVNLSTT